MPEIVLHTKINAPIERCFHLSLSVDLHKAGVLDTKEEAIAGVTKGCMKLNDTVTWQAIHFGIKQQMTSKIGAYNEPHFFISEMIKGPFKKPHHQHIFKEENGYTLMTDIFHLEAPLGPLGWLAEKIFLVRYMRKFLQKRNLMLKEVAESEDWKKFLNLPKFG